MLAEEGVPTERLVARPMRRRCSRASPATTSRSACYEPEAGALRARDATRAIVALARRKGVRFVGGEARPARRAASTWRVSGSTPTSSSGPVAPWLAGIFPEPRALRVTRQEVLHFGAPIAWETPPVPAWVDYDAAFYGVGDLDGRGVKVSPDREGPEFDPDRDDRTLTAEAESAARAYLGRRFPALADAPLVFSRVCPYCAHRRHALPDRAATPSTSASGCSAAAPGTGSSTAPRWASTWPTCSRAAAEPDARFALGERGPGTSLRTAGTALARAELGDLERPLHHRGVRVADVAVRALAER